MKNKYNTTLKNTNNIVIQNQKDWNMDLWNITSILMI